MKHQAFAATLDIDTPSELRSLAGSLWEVCKRAKSTCFNRLSACQISRAESGGRVIAEQMRLEALSTAMSAQQTVLEIITNVCSKDIDFGV